jgi:DNA-binding HxlR family transcriptional regulator
MDDCGFTTAIRVIGGKWKVDILCALNAAPRRFGRLRQLIPGISEKMLAKQLRDMEADGLVHREVHDTLPPKVVYSLTDLGLSLRAASSACASGARCTSARRMPIMSRHMPRFNHGGPEFTNEVQHPTMISH